MTGSVGRGVTMLVQRAYLPRRHAVAALVVIGGRLGCDGTAQPEWRRDKHADLKDQPQGGDKREAAAH